MEGDDDSDSGEFEMPCEQQCDGAVFGGPVAEGEAADPPRAGEAAGVVNWGDDEGVEPQEPPDDMSDFEPPDEPDAQLSPGLDVHPAEPAAPDRGLGGMGEPFPDPSFHVGRGAPMPDPGADAVSPRALSPPAEQSPPVVQARPPTPPTPPVRPPRETPPARPGPQPADSESELSSLSSPSGSIKTEDLTDSDDEVPAPPPAAPRAAPPAAPPPPDPPKAAEAAAEAAPAAGSPCGGESRTGAVESAAAAHSPGTSEQPRSTLSGEEASAVHHGEEASRQELQRCEKGARYQVQEAEAITQQLIAVAQLQRTGRGMAARLGAACSLTCRRGTLECSAAAAICSALAALPPATPEAGHAAGHEEEAGHEEAEPSMDEHPPSEVHKAGLETEEEAQLQRRGSKRRSKSEPGKTGRKKSRGEAQRGSSGTLPKGTARRRSSSAEADGTTPPRRKSRRSSSEKTKSSRRRSTSRGIPAGAGEAAAVVAVSALIACTACDRTRGDRMLRCSPGDGIRAISSRESPGVCLLMTSWRYEHGATATLRTLSHSSSWGLRVAHAARTTSSVTIGQVESRTTLGGSTEVPPDSRGVCVAQADNWLSALHQVSAQPTVWLGAVGSAGIPPSTLGQLMRAARLSRAGGLGKWLQMLRTAWLPEKKRESLRNKKPPLELLFEAYSPAPAAGRERGIPLLNMLKAAQEPSLETAGGAVPERSIPSPYNPDQPARKVSIQLPRSASDGGLFLQQNSPLDGGAVVTGRRPSTAPGNRSPASPPPRLKGRFLGLVFRAAPKRAPRATGGPLFMLRAAMVPSMVSSPSLFKLCMATEPGRPCLGIAMTAAGMQQGSRSNKIIERKPPLQLLLKAAEGPWSDPLPRHLRQLREASLPPRARPLEALRIAARGDVGLRHLRLLSAATHPPAPRDTSPYSRGVQSHEPAVGTEDEAVLETVEGVVAAGSTSVTRSPRAEQLADLDRSFRELVGLRSAISSEVGTAARSTARERGVAAALQQALLAREEEQARLRIVAREEEERRDTTGAEAKSLAVLRLLAAEESYREKLETELRFWFGCVSLSAKEESCRWGVVRKAAAEAPDVAAFRRQARVKAANRVHDAGVFRYSYPPVPPSRPRERQAPTRGVLGTAIAHFSRSEPFTRSIRQKVPPQAVPRPRQPEYPCTDKTRRTIEGIHHRADRERDAALKKLSAQSTESVVSEEPQGLLPVHEEAFRRIESGVEALDTQLVALQRVASGAATQAVRQERSRPHSAKAAGELPPLGTLGTAHQDLGTGNVAATELTGRYSIHVDETSARSRLALDACRSRQCAWLPQVERDDRAVISGDFDHSLGVKLNQARRSKLRATS
eukprot:Hpha_TRINITY_DN1955_c0_g1::TRINITY_DN1955_c0_g1_i1::g.31003::m.31003